MVMELVGNMLTLGSFGDCDIKNELRTSGLLSKFVACFLASEDVGVLRISW